MFNVNSILIFSLVAIVLWLNAKASLAILQDSLSSRKQRTVQLLIVWLVPLIGALTVLAVHRPTEKSSGKYSEESPPPDDFHGPKHGRKDSDDD